MNAPSFLPLAREMILPGATDLGGGWSRDAEGRLHKAPEIVEAFGEHCYERVQGGGDFTRITLRAPHGQPGSVFIGLVDGWLAAGAEHIVSGRTCRLTLTPQQSAAPWWRKTEVPAEFPRLALVREPDEAVRNFGEVA